MPARRQRRGLLVQRLVQPRHADAAQLEDIAKAFVVSNAVRAPFPSRMAFVAIVEACSTCAWCGRRLNSFGQRGDALQRRLGEVLRRRGNLAGPEISVIVDAGDVVNVPPTSAAMRNVAGISREPGQPRLLYLDAEAWAVQRQNGAVANRKASPMTSSS